MSAEKSQRATFFLLLVFGILYFFAFVIPNAYGAAARKFCWILPAMST